MRLRFTIRDLLWLTVVIALVVAWWLSDRRRITERDAAIKNLTDWGGNIRDSYSAVNQRLHVEIERLEKQQQETK
jgi:hypothetical protein